MPDLTTREVAARVGLSERRVQELCREGLVPGAYQHGTSLRAPWCIPASAVRAVLAMKRSPDPDPEPDPDADLAP